MGQAAVIYNEIQDQTVVDDEGGAPGYVELKVKGTIWELAAGSVNKRLGRNSVLLEMLSKLENAGYCLYSCNEVTIT